MIREFFHYSAEALTSVHSVEQSVTDHFKPKGLWVSDCNAGDGWRSWCEAEDFNLGRLALRSIVSVEMENVLLLPSVTAIRDFHDQWADGPEYLRYPRWDRLSGKYAGVIISPYQWSIRLDHPSWYYSWDCASGCIWDASAITEIRADADYQRAAA